MSIASEITRLQGVKADILTAIADKGVEVPIGSALADCPGLIGLIDQGVIKNEFKYFNILGKDYKYLKIDNGIYFPCENLSYYDSNIQFGNLQDNVACASYFNNDASYSNRGLYYSEEALTYIKSLLDTKFKYISSYYINKLYDYIGSFFDFPLSNTLKTYMAKSNTWKKSQWNQSLDFFGLNIDPFGSMHYNMGQDDFNVFCFLCGSNSGLVTGSAGNRNNGSFNITSGIGMGFGYFYNIRFIIDEN